MVPGPAGSSVELGLRRGGRYSAAPLIRVRLARARFAARSAGPVQACLRLATGGQAGGQYGSVGVGGGGHRGREAETQTPPATPEGAEEGGRGEGRRVVWREPVAEVRVEEIRVAVS